MTAVAAAPWVGQPIKRKEDPRLIMGRARYIDDINVTGQLWAAFVRSPEAHAKIVSIDTSAAREYPGVHAVFTGHDLDLEAPLPMAWVPPGITVNNPPHWSIAKDEVNCVGDPVALVIGSDRYAVVDAAEQVLVEYDPLPVVVDLETALDDDAPLVHEELGTNKCHEWSLGGGDLEAGFAAADVIVERRVVNHRTAGAAIEPRGVLADYRAGSLTLTSSTQVPHFLRLFLGLQLGISEEKVRAIAPEVGGGFGSKLQIYGEEIALAWASRKLERPIKWVESRTEGMLATHHGRDQVAHVRIGATKEGKITAFHTTIYQDLGAYLMLLDADDPVAGRVRDERRLRHPGGPDRHHRRLHQQDLDRRDPRGRAPRGHAHDRGLRRPAGGRARDGPARAAPEELHGPGELPARDRARRRLRLRQLPGRAGPPAHPPRRRTPSRPRRPPASCAASASRPTPRSAAWRRRA